SPKRLFGNSQTGTPAPLQQSVVTEVQRTPGVALASGSVFDQGLIYDKKDNPLITTGAPMFISGLQPARFDPFSYVQGRAPQASDEVALDKTHASNAGFKLGDMVRLSGKGPQRAFRLVGITQFGD